MAATCFSRSRSIERQQVAALIATSTPLIGRACGTCAAAAGTRSSPRRRARVRILRRVAAGGVEQDRLVREPPVAVARAADAAQRFLAELLRQREVEAGVDDRRGLARARRPDDDVPRQLVEILRARACDFLSASTASSNRLRSCAASPRTDARGPIRRLALAHRFEACACCASQLFSSNDERPDHDRRRNRDDARQHEFQRPVIREREVRAREPDQQREQQQPSSDQERPLLRNASMVSSLPVDDFDATVARAILRRVLRRVARLRGAHAARLRCAPNSRGPFGSASTTLRARARDNSKLSLNWNERIGWLSVCPTTMTRPGTVDSAARSADQRLVLRD